MNEDQGSESPIGLFVTIEIIGGEAREPRQGWLINEDPPIIRGESGTVYAGAGEFVIVEPQPPAPWWMEIYEFGLKGKRIHLMHGPRMNPVLAIRNPENGAVVKCFL